MKCDNCKKETQWLEIIGSNFICHKCVNKHKIMGFILRTHADTFRTVIKKLQVPNFEAMMQLTRKEIESVTNLKKYGIILKTTNIVELE